MKYSGSDFKFTSQANHMAKIQAMKKDYERRGFHLQRLYKRRKTDENGIMRSTFGSIMDTTETSKKVSNSSINVDLDQNQNGIIDKSEVSMEVKLVEF
jgi:hypothetical protein